MYSIINGIIVWNRALVIRVLKMMDLSDKRFEQLFMKTLRETGPGVQQESPHLSVAVDTVVKNDKRRGALKAIETSDRVGKQQTTMNQSTNIPKTAIGSKS